MAKPKSAEDFFSKLTDWNKELSYLRDLILDTELEETIKWGMPTYTLGGKNVLGLGGFKNHFGIWFFNGALIDDPDGHLLNAQDGKTKAMRQLRFESFEEIEADIINDLVQKAIKNQKDGKEVMIDVNREAEIPFLLDKAFSEDSKLRSHFDKLTPGRQREYAQYIAGAKQEATKMRRVEKIIPMIKKGIGLNDKYQQ